MPARGRTRRRGVSRGTPKLFVDTEPKTTVVSQSVERPSDAGSNPEDPSPSFAHLLAVWFLVGSSFWTLGFTIVDVLPDPLPISRMGAGLLAGTFVVVSLWIGGFRPSVQASVGYFFADLGFSTVLGLLVGPLLFPRVTAWLEVGLYGLSIVLAATLVFTEQGRRVRASTRQWLLDRLRIPGTDAPSSEQ